MVGSDGSMTCRCGGGCRGRAAPTVDRMRVLLTGGAGFIGSHIADALAADGDEPVLLDALLPQAHSGPVPPWTERYEVVVGDVTDPTAVAALLRGVDAVCHQAAVVGHGLDPSDAPLYSLNNDH